MFKSLASRLVVAIVTILFVTVGLMAFLSHSKFHKTFSSLFQSRIESLLKDMRNTIQTSLALGLPLQDLINTEEILAREKSQDDQILSLAVVDPMGKILFSSEEGQVQKAISEDWMRAWDQKRDIWTYHEAEALVIGIGMVDSIDQIAGCLVLRYSRAYLDKAVNGVRNRLYQAGFFIFLGCSVLAFLAGGLTMRPTRNFKTMNESLAHLVSAGTPTMTGNDAETDFENEFVKFQDLSGRAMNEIEHALQEVRERGGMKSEEGGA